MLLSTFFKIKIDDEKSSFYKSPMTDCSICRDPLNVSETGKVELSCSHTFHLVCITRWFSTGENTRTCPMCRAAPKEKEFAADAPSSLAASSGPLPNLPPIDVNAANALAAQRATLQRQRDNVRAQIGLQLNMLDQFSRDIQRMRREVTSTLNDMDNQNNYNIEYRNGVQYDNIINRNDIIHFNYDQR